MEKLKYKSVFDAIAENSAEAADMKFRADLMLVMRELFEDQRWTQADIMAALEIAQPRASELMTGKLDKFSSDKLIGFLAKLGYQLQPHYHRNQPDGTAEIRCIVSRI